MHNLGQETRVGVIAIPDAVMRARIRETLVGIRWQVREARGGAEAIQSLDEQPGADILVFDAWLPDLEIHAFAEIVKQLHPNVAQLRLHDLYPGDAAARSEHREVCQALRSIVTEQDKVQRAAALSNTASVDLRNEADCSIEVPRSEPEDWQLAELVGRSAPMRELCRLIRLVAPHQARVLIEGETGTGKELVANALHRLSLRAHKPFVVLNCAAIPESLLEAELFGHTRGAFTGATHSRVGRIEAANGGTLFLDEIGEMPLALQSKLLRFLENGELQRIGDNGTTRVDVRVLAATHRDLDESVARGGFRLDLLHRLSVFPIEVPSLRERLDDLPLLAEHFLAALAKEVPRKRLTSDALSVLRLHAWPGNVRELGHVLHRGAILAGSSRQITANEIRVRRKERS